MVIVPGLGLVEMSLLESAGSELRPGTMLVNIAAICWRVLLFQPACTGRRPALFVLGGACVILCKDWRNT